MEVDLLGVISGDDFVVNENITVHQPSLREIKEFGEKRFFNMIYTICAIPSDVKSQLWDNGKGFDPNHIPVHSKPDHSGFGLSMMRERVYLLSGNITIDSKPGEGCSIIVDVPITKEGS